mgnify:FL=1
MLTQRPARKSVAVLTLLAALLTFLIGVSPAAAAECHIDSWGNQVCDIEVGQPGTPGTPGGGTAPAGFTPGPATCLWDGVEGSEDPDLIPREIPCSTGDDYWSNGRQCYWSIDDPQRPAPNGKSLNVGAYYSCDPYVSNPALCGAPTNCYGFSLWLDAPPPGITRYTPAQAAGMLVRTFVLQPITIGMAPERKVRTDDPAGTAAYRRTWVGIPVWLWVDSTSESTWGPLTRTATYGGVTVTATAQVQSLTWSSGDGQTVNCGVGTPFNAAAMADQLAVDSPTCGFRYQRTSGSGTFTVSASTTWVVQWNGGGENGTIAMPTTTSSAQVRVGELQSVNTANYGD